MEGWVHERGATPSMIDYHAATCMIEAIGSREPGRFAEAVLAVAGGYARVQHCAVFAFQKYRNPELISAATRVGHNIAKDTASPYIQEFFRKDEIQDIIVRRAGVAPNGNIFVHRQSQDDISDPHYRFVCYSGVNIKERIANLIRVRHNVWVSVNLYRDVSHGPFVSAEIEAIRNLSSLFAHAAARHYTIDHHGTLRARNFVTDELARHGHNLTAREREVAIRILDGQTTKVIAGSLAISPSTVVTYRERAYEKLGVRTRAELFAAFIGKRDQLRNIDCG
jgi:DNA-binding CsgD family transcriptional regulator